MQVFFLLLPHAEGLPFPRYQSDDAAGVDLIAAIPARRTVILNTGERELIPTGLAVELPKGYEAQVRPRSGLALRYGVTVLNSPGTIDADYRGEIAVILINFGKDPFVINRGDRIAQLVVARFERVELAVRDELSQTVRGPGGFGSTGRGSEGVE